VLERILRGIETTVYATFGTDGTPTNPSPDSATVTITRDDGTVLVTDDPTADAGTGVFSYTFTTAQAASLDLFDVAWTATFNGSPQTIHTYVEVVGGFLFTEAEARAVKPLDDTNKYTDAEIIAGRTLAEAALEDACGLSFVPRYFREKVDGLGVGDVLLTKPRPLTITAATVDGTALSADQLADLELYRDGRVYNPSGWAEGRRNVVLTGTAGFQFPPPRVGRACLLLAKRFLVDSPLNDRTTVFNHGDGSSEFFVTAGVRDAVFDVPEANAIVQDYGVRGAG
jgi:hypothetical protein